MARTTVPNLLLSRALAPDPTPAGAGRKPRRDRARDGRRPKADPASAEREFVQAIEAYKVSSGRMFPTWSEVLEVLRDLGYVKVAADQGPAL
jgi:hypothetical protein